MTRSLPWLAGRGIRRCKIDGCARLQLDRAERGNRIDISLAQELCSFFEEAEFDDEIRLIVITASGSAFCRGADGPEPPSVPLPDCWRALRRQTRPVLAAIQGDVFDEGMELALACDLRIGGTSAQFRMAQVAEGRLPRFGGSQLLPRIIGRMPALDLLLTGRILGADEALELGLLTRLVADEDVEDELEKLIELLLKQGPIALRLAKEAIWKGLDLTLDQGIRLEQDLYVLSQTTVDRAEGIEAFRARRPPRFTGR